MPQFAACAIVLTMLGIRLGLALSHAGMWGVDGGAYFLNLNYVLNNEPTGILYLRPPLAPGWLLVPFVAIWGEDAGYKIFSAVFSLAPVFPFWLLSRQFLSPWQSVGALLFLLIDLELAEMFVTGVVPLIALGFLTLTLWAMLKLAKQPDKAAFVAIIVSLPSIAFINQTTAGIAAILVPIALASLWRFAGRAAANRIVVPLAIGVLLAASALPWYLGVRFGADMTRYPGSLIYTYPWKLTDIWLQLLIGASVGLWLLFKAKKAKDEAIKVLAVSILTLTFLSAFLSHDEALINIFYRSRYFLAVPVYIGLAWLVFHKWLWRVPRPLALFYGVAAFFFVSSAWVYQVQNQASISNLMTTDSVEAMAYVKPMHGDDKTIVTNSEGLAWWIAGLTRTDAVWPIAMEPPKAWEQQHRDVMCVFGWAECDVSAAVDRLAADYMVIDTKLRWSGQRQPAIWQAPDKPYDVMRENAVWLEPVWNQGSTYVYRINTKYAKGLNGESR